MLKKKIIQTNIYKTMMKSQESMAENNVSELEISA